MDFVSLISGFISKNKSRSCFSFCMNFAFFLKKRFFIYFEAFSRLFGVVGCNWGGFFGEFREFPV